MNGIGVPGLGVNVGRDAMVGRVSLSSTFEKPGNPLRPDVVAPRQMLCVPGRTPISAQTT